MVSNGQRYRAELWFQMVNVTEQNYDNEFNDPNPQRTGQAGWAALSIILSTAHRPHVVHDDYEHPNTLANCDTLTKRRKKKITSFASYFPRAQILIRQLTRGWCAHARLQPKPRTSHVRIFLGVTRLPTRPKPTPSRACAT